MPFIVDYALVESEHTTSIGTDKAEFWITCSITYSEGYIRISLILCCRDLSNRGFVHQALDTQIHGRVLFVNDVLISCGIDIDLGCFCAKVLYIQFNF